MIKRSLKKDKKRIKKIRKGIEKVEKLGYYFTAGIMAKKEGFLSDAYRNFKKGELGNSSYIDLCIENHYTLIEMVSPKKDLRMEEILKNEKQFRPENPSILHSKRYEKQDPRNWNQLFGNQVDYDFIRPIIRYTTEKQFSSERIIIYN